MGSSIGISVLPILASVLQIGPSFRTSFLVVIPVFWYK